ncbi:MAG: outer membrane protein assembly factor BamA [Succinivibrionaceae bacterium]
MNIKFLAKCIFCLMMGTNTVYAASTTTLNDEIEVKNIKINGLYRVTKGAVLLALPISVGDTLSKQDVSNALKKVYETNSFDSVDASYSDDGTLIIDVKERPTIVNVTYAGNNNIKEEQLDQIIKTQGIKVGSILDVQKLKDLENSLEDFYHGMGRYQASVNTILVYLPRNRVDVKFNFTEGVKAKIEQINIVGNKSFTEEKLLGQFNLRDKVPWWNFLADRYFNAQILNGDLETLRSFYMNRGYVKFNIKDTRVEITPDKKSLYLGIVIDEGEQYSYDSFSIIGETFGYSKEMEHLIPLAKGDVYNAAQVSHTEQILANFMGKYGYANTKVKAYPTIDDDNKLVSLNFHVEPGKRVYVNNVNIMGNTITTDKVIRREVRQMDGTWLSNEAVDVSKRRINQLGFFETVDVTHNKIGSNIDNVDLDIKVKERPTGSIKAGVGFGTESGITLNGEISQDNFLGYGGRASIAINTNKYDKKLDVSYYEPYLTLDAVSLGGNVFFEKFKAGDANIIDYTNTKFGASLDLGYPLDEHNYISYGLMYEHNKISQTGSYLQMQQFWNIYTSETDADNEVKFVNYKASISYKRNYLDRSVLPTEGNKQSASITVSVPGSDIQFYKMRADTTHFYPLDKERKYILNFRGKVGYGNGYGSMNGKDQVLPFFENFYTGGDEWLRGFEYNTVGPKAIYTTSYMGNYSSMGTDNASGGNAIYAASLQLIVPTPFASEGYENSLRTSLFVDVGNVWDTTYNKDKIPSCIGGCNNIYDYSDPWMYRASAGVTLIWISPMGPLGFSLSKPIKKEDGDDTEFFSFSLGKTF